MNKSTPDDASDWNSYLKVYKSERLANPPLVPPKHVTRYEKSREEIRFNPITQKFRNETKVLPVENNNTLRHLVNERSFDIVTGEARQVSFGTEGDRVPKQTIRPKNNKPPSVDRNFNIVTNLDPNNKVSEEKTIQSGPAKRFRDHCIVTNKYYEDHENKSKNDELNTQNECAERFWKTRNYNPIVGTYYDQRKEKQFQNNRSSTEKDHPNHAGKNLPPKLRDAEGAAYNIINCHVKDENKLEKHSNPRRLVGGTPALEVENRLKGSSELVTDFQDQRSINRISTIRFSDAHRHGYDIVSHASYKGRNAKPILPPRTIQRNPHTAVTQALSRQNTSNNNSNTNTFNSTNNTTRVPSSRNMTPQSIQPQHQQQQQQQNSFRRASSNASESSSRSIVPPLSIPSSTPQSSSRSSNVLQQNAKMAVRTGGFC
eukprot:TRINITY_DN325_c0_g1_i2.p1 TRINITY_DN325_c0_g1~~TRINITY_DN325_c0_g1_i2.p1  ORF type:complete len:429 (+),score=109.64 TRINITY_DN325_c0_g1_i2:94-1380(+)